MESFTNGSNGGRGSSNNSIYFNDEIIIEQIEEFIPTVMPEDVDLNNIYCDAIISISQSDSDSECGQPVVQFIDYGDNIQISNQVQCQNESNYFTFISSSSDLSCFSFSSSYDTNSQFEDYNSDVIDRDIQDKLKREYSWKRLIFHYRPLRVDGSYLLNNKHVLKAIGESVKLYDNWLQDLVSCYCEGVKKDGYEFINKWNQTAELNKNLFLTQLKDLSSLINTTIPNEIIQLLENKQKVDNGLLIKYGISISKINNYKSNMEKKKRLNK